jgi:hypothetical protein
LAKTYNPIATQTLGSAVASVTFSSIPATYTDLVVVVANLTTASAGGTVFMEFNTDASAVYSNTWLNGNGSAASSARRTADVKNYIGGYITGTSTTEPCTTIAHVMNYANTTTYKTTLSRYSLAGAETNTVVNLWRSTAAINAIRIFSGSNLNTGTIVTLYGVKSA